MKHGKDREESFSSDLQDEEAGVDSRVHYVRKVKEASLISLEGEGMGEDWLGGGGMRLVREGREGGEERQVAEAMSDSSER